MCIAKFEVAIILSFERVELLHVEGSDVSHEVLVDRKVLEALSPLLE